MTYMSQDTSHKNTESKRNAKINDRNVIIKQLIRPLGFLLIFIMVCAFLAQYLTGSETLTEYAQKNPELAYGPRTQEQDTVTVKNEGTQETDTVTVKNEGTQASAEKPAAVPISGNTVTPEDDTAYTTDESSVAESVEMSNHPERITYQPGFYYEPLTDTVKQRITGISYPESGCTVPYEDLLYVRLLYHDFNGEEQIGELICNKAIAQDMVEIFYELYQNDYQIERIRLIDEYGGDDTASMADNNTSCFNYRVVDGTTSLSKHAYGLAIDINPFYNPYVVYNKGGTGNTYISPAGSEIYADRSQDFAYKIDENDLCYRLFIEHGFTWGGNWNSSKDYQHFQKALN